MMRLRLSGCKPAMPMYQALLRIHKNKGVEFDSHAVDLFVKTLGLYPVGSLVELNTSELGVVFQPNVDDSRRPVVGLVTLPGGRERGAPLSWTQRGARSRMAAK